MYAEFYGLTARPFQLTPDARFFFESTVHRQAMAYLVYGLHHAEGFIIVTGEVGAGKTILVDNLLSTIDRTTFVAAKIVTTHLAGDDLLHMVAAGFGVAKEGLTKGSLLQRISDFALSQHRSGKRLLLIIDEAQNLSFEALEELRMLSNIVLDRTMVLQSFLLGQPQFRTILASPRLEQLRQRVTAAYHLGPLSEAEGRAYVEHRLRRATSRTIFRSRLLPRQSIARIGTVSRRGLCATPRGSSIFSPRGRLRQPFSSWAGLHSDILP